MFLGHDLTWQGPPMQNLTPYFDFPSHIAYSLWYFWGDLWVFVGETSNAKAKLSKNFLSPDQKWSNFGGFRRLGVRWYKSFQFLLQKAHPCPNLRRLSHFAWRSVEGSDRRGVPEKSRKSQNLPLEWSIAVNTGLHSRAPVMTAVLQLGFVFEHNWTTYKGNWWSLLRATFPTSPPRETLRPGKSQTQP